MSKVIAECQFDGSQALSYVDDDYKGVVAMSYESHRVFRVTFSCVGEAERAATFAINKDVCGYSNVSIHQTDDTAQFESADNWLF